MVFRCIIFCHGYYLTERSWNYTLELFVIGHTHHRVGFTAACLPICKDCSIVTVEDIVDQGKGTLLVYKTLKRLRSEDAIEGETFGLLLIIFSIQVYLIILVVDFYDVDAG